jgi:hypothetical protein|tara:strand:- start:520 stop:723 length:204 start_codon:yes stop_codon:yes gene_type:complete
MPLMKVSVYRKKRFAEGSRPSVNTIKKWIDNGEIQGEIIGGMYYVDLDKIKPANHLVSKVLRNDATA